jgi:hypothetical protein
MNRVQNFAVYWNEWLQHTDRSDASLRIYTLSIVDAVQRAAQRGSFRALQTLQELYDIGAPLCIQEPLLSTYEAGEFHIELTIADSSFLSSRYRTGWEIARDALQRMDAADERRARECQPRRGLSELRITALGVMAACFWAERSLASKAAARKVASDFWERAEILWRGLESPSVGDDHRESLQHRTAIYELYVCKACLHLGGKYLERAVREFNARHDESLTTITRDFETLAENEIRTGWYWDFERAKLSRAANPDHQAMQLCARNRLAAARLVFGGNTLGVLKRYWESQERELHP